MKNRTISTWLIITLCITWASAVIGQSNLAGIALIATWVFTVFAIIRLHSNTQ